jgi:hypothetical protein
VDPVPDPLILRKSCSCSDRTRDLWTCSQELWPLDHRDGHVISRTSQIFHPKCKLHLLMTCACEWLLRLHATQTCRRSCHLTRGSRETAGVICFKVTIKLLLCLTKHASFGKAVAKVSHILNRDTDGIEWSLSHPYRLSVVVKALRYKPEGCGFDTRWGDF